MIHSAFRKNQAILIPFIMGGHPSKQTTIEAIMLMSQLGVGIIELGVPFSDPVADGPINQRAADIALQNHITLGVILEMVGEVRARGCQTPIILFSYYNPILNFGEAHFINEAKKAGVNGVLIVDLPPEEGRDFYKQLKEAVLGVGLLISPTTDPSRFKLYTQLQPSFIYYLSRLSVTGLQQALADHLETEVRALRLHFPQTKIVVGFGISTPDQAQYVASFADGVVIGSLFVKTLEENGLKALKQLVASSLEALRK